MSRKIHITGALGGDSEGNYYTTAGSFRKMLHGVWEERAMGWPIPEKEVERTAVLGASYSMDEIVALIMQDIGLWPRSSRPSVALALKRIELRKAGDFEGADKIRDQLIAVGDYCGDTRVAG
jgi:hypothetical protein